MTALKTLTLLIAALAMSIVESLRAVPSKDEDEDVGLFIGSARPLAAVPHVAERRS
jgi:hypothetical protein